MRVNVCYRVPVVVVVDTDTGEIEQVVADIECISSPEYCETSEGCKELKDDDPVAVQAYTIAEQKEWPAWEFGF